MGLKRLIVTSVALLALAGSVAAPALAQDATPEATAEMGAAEQIVIAAPGIRPEGVAYDAVGGRFLFGSLSEGTIRQMMDDGTVTPFIEDPELISTTGVHVDEVGNRLLVPNTDAAVFADPAAVGSAGLAAYDLTSGERIFMVDLAAVGSTGRNFANDVTVDGEGNAYVTNSFSPIIYKVDPEGNASIFAQDDRFTAPNIGLNGIDYSPNGYLLAAVAGASKLYKIPLDDPTNISEVALSEPFGIDGMVLAEDGTLYAVAALSDLTQAVVSVTSDDDWATGTVTARAQTGGGATTLALRDGEPWYINAYLSNPDAQQYEIVHAELVPVAQEVPEPGAGATAEATMEAPMDATAEPTASG